MKVATSIYCVKEHLRNSFDTLWEEFLRHRPAETADSTVWHWSLVVAEGIRLPKAWKSSQKSDPKGYLKTGLESGYLQLSVAVKPTKGKIWQSSVLRIDSLPAELISAVSPRERQAIGAGKWQGRVVEIFTPLHQKHPGMAEHAVIGGVVCGKAAFFMLSDRKAPMSAPIWSPYELIPDKKMAVPQFMTIERAHQKEFLAAEPGAEIDFGMIRGTKMHDSDIEKFLGLVNKFSWSMDRNSSTGALPKNIRKFRLGEEITSQERKLTPNDFLRQALEMMD